MSDVYDPAAPATPDHAARRRGVLGAALLGTLTLGVGGVALTRTGASSPTPDAPTLPVDPQRGTVDSPALPDPVVRELPRVEMTPMETPTTAPTSAAPATSSGGGATGGSPTTATGGTAASPAPAPDASVRGAERVATPNQASDAVDYDASFSQVTERAPSTATPDSMTFPASYVAPEGTLPAPLAPQSVTGAPVKRVEGSPRMDPKGPSGASLRARQKATVFGAAGPLTDLQAETHLLRRCTFGPRPGDRVAVARQGIDGWLEAQLNPTSVPDPMGDAIASQYPLGQADIPTVVASIKRYGWTAQYDTARLVLGRQIFSSRQLFEVVVDVFANHLNVTTPSENVWASGPDYHHQVIRRHAFGRFEDMLQAAMRHPSMLTYLSNNQSNRTHVNENLGRELLELHTVGIDGGYTEADVLAAAKILSGRGITSKEGDPNDQRYSYDARRHWTGAVKVLAFTDANADAAKGEAVGDRLCTYLAKHPKTAQTIARKLAVRFVSDAPSAELVSSLAEVYLANDTAIVPVLRALFRTEEFWSSVGAKTRRPAEDMVASARALDMPIPDAAQARKGVDSLYWRLWGVNNHPLGWGPPNGYPDVTAAWLSAGQLLERFTTHRALTGGWFAGMKSTIATDVFKPLADETVGAWIDRVCTFLTAGTMPATVRATLVAFLEVPEDSQASRVAWKAPHLAALVLDSIYCQAR